MNILDDSKDPDEQATYTGQEIGALADVEWDKILSKPRLVFARMQPEHKLTIVQQLQRRHEVVAVTGDGVNDSPALKRADVGIAMGIAGTEVAKEAAKIICADDNFASIVVGIRYGRLIFDNLQKIIMYVVAHLPCELFPSLYQYIFSMPLGLSPLLLLCIELTDLLPSIAMSFEEPEGDVMELPPRNMEKDRMVTIGTLVHSYFFIGLLETILCTALYLHILIVHFEVPVSTMGAASAYFVRDAPDLLLKSGAVLTWREQLETIQKVINLHVHTHAHAHTHARTHMHI